MSRQAMTLWGSGCLAAVLVLGSITVFWLGGATAVDQWWHDLMVDTRPDALIAFSHVLNRVGGGWIAALIVPLLIAVVLALVRRWRSALFALAAFAGSAVLVQALKHLFGRARPEDMLVLSDFGSFPSGHTANAATIAVVLWLLFPRAWVIICGVLWIVLMAFSRTVLAVHWSTDTVGGALVGAAAALLIGALLLRWARLDRADADAPRTLS